MTFDPLAGNSIPQVAKRLGVSEDTVRRMIARGELRARRAGVQWRVSERALADWWAEDGVTRGKVVELRRRVG